MSASRVAQSSVNAALARDVLGDEAARAPAPVEPRKVSVLMELEIRPRDPHEESEATAKRVEEWLRNADELQAMTNIHVNVFGGKRRAKWEQGSLRPGMLGDHVGGRADFLVMQDGQFAGAVIAFVRSGGDGVWEARCILSPENTFNSLYSTREQAIAWLEKAVTECMTEWLLIVR